MKLLDLRLQAVGPFSDEVISFDPVARLHVVYGPNEAGKSSALRALQALLFGFPHTITEAFVHEAADLRVGARIVWRSGADGVFFRRKGRGQTLLNESGAALADDPLAAALAGLDGAAWRLAFGIDHTALRKGGALLLQNEGDVGDTLFAAATGGPHVKTVLKEFDVRARKLYGTGNASNPIFNAAKGALTDAEKRLREATASAPAARDRERELVKQEAERTRVMEGTRLRRAEVRRCVRLLRARPRVAERAGLLDRLQDDADRIELPAAFGTDVARLRAELHVAQASNDSVASELRTLVAAVEVLPAASGLLAAAARIAALHERIGHVDAGHERIAKMQPHRQSLADALRAALHGIEPGLSEHDVAARLPSPVQVAEIERLAEAHSAQSALLDASATLVERWQREAVRLAATPAAAVAGVEDHLEPAVTAARSQGDVAQRGAKTAAAQAAGRDRADAVLAALHPWHGSLVEAARLPVPPQATVESHARAWDRSAASAERLRERRAEREDRERAARTAVECHELAGDVPTEEALSHARLVRDSAIARLAEVAQLDETAQRAEASAGGELRSALASRHTAAVATAVVAADLIADRLRREANRVTDFARARAELHSAATEQLAQTRDEAEHAAASADREAAWLAEWSAVGIAPRPPREMAAWLATHAQVAGALETVAAAGHEADAVRTLLDGHRTALARALGACGEATEPTDALATLLVRAERRLATARKARADDDARAQQLLAAQREVADAEGQLQAARRRMAAWTTDWVAALAPIGRPATTTPQVARLVLGLLHEAKSRLADLQKLDEQSAGILREEQRFQLDVAALDRDLGIDGDTAEPSTRVRALQASCQDAQQIENQRADLTARRDQARAKASAAADRLAAAELGLVDACQRAGCARAAELDGVIAAAEFRRVSRARVAELDRDLLQDGEGRSLAECAAEAVAADVDELAATQAAAEAALAQLDAERTRVDTRLAELKHELGAIDGSQRAADAAADAHAALATMRAAAEQWAVVKLAEWLLQAEVARYRERAQGPVMRRASEFLERLTLGSIARLEVDDSSEPASLVGVRRTGKRVRVDEMSEGTRDQLFLALRLASIEHTQLARAEPLPVVLDDVLLAFDDARAAVTLEVLAGLAETVQVLLFTHQRSVAVAAQRMGGRVSVRELGVAVPQ
ncbi:MAG: hypothetical protein EXR79_15185 [Myxococcales bacterium]|nr:hypothetical protein [Myxococcales bacterium]